MNINEESAKESSELLGKTTNKVYLALQGEKYLVGDRFSCADLASAALLAPLCKPTKYGLDWPQKYPKPLTGIIAAYSGRLGWVNRVYKSHR